MNTRTRTDAGALANIQSSRSSPVRVLLAEDESLTRRLFALTLVRAGYAVTSAEDGLQAWQALQSHDFDLLITDNQMPRMTGLELVTKARLQRMTLPIIMACGSAKPAAASDSEWLGTTAWLQKPFTPDALLEIVRQVLRRHSNSLTSGLAGVIHSVTPYEHCGLNE